MLYNAKGLLFGFSGAAPIEGLALASKGELLRALLGSQPAEHPCRLLIVRMRRKPQRLGLLGRLLHKLARARGLSGDHGKARPVVLADALTVVGGVSVLISRQLGAQIGRAHV